MVLRGNITLFIGPMFAGKTTKLLLQLEAKETKGNKCILIKHKCDDRYSDTEVISHDKFQKRTAVKTEYLNDLILQAMKYDVIGIDEGQFFKDLVLFCDRLANEGKNVIVSALDSDFKRNPFMEVCKLISISEHVIKLEASCHICHEKASFTWKFFDNNSHIIDVGGSEKYFPVCRKCFANLNKLKIEERDSLNPLKRGLLIAIEGCDKSGKTRNVTKLMFKLQSKQIPVVSYCFPHRKSSIGNVIDKYLKREITLDKESLCLLFTANRWEMKNEIENKLKNGINVILDRYIYSGIAYAVANNVNTINDWKRMEGGLTAPDIVFFLDVKPQYLIDRKNYGSDVFENISFQEKVYDLFCDLKDVNWICVNANRRFKTVNRFIFKHILNLLE